MKTLCSHHRINAVFVAAVFVLLFSRSALLAVPTNTVALSKSDGFAVQPPFIEPAIPKSAFLQPKKNSEGRDPFFPRSGRVYGVDQTVKTVVAPTPVADLALKGISGTPEQPLAIINTTTFSAGEESDVMTKAGKIRIRCVEIKMSEGTVLVQVGGQSRELRLTPSKEAAPRR